MIRFRGTASMRSLLMLLATLLAGAPVAAAEEAGRGELWLHQAVWDYYEVFRQDQSAHFFAVSTNGLGAGYSRCKTFNGCSPLDGKREALLACSKSAPDVEGACYVFANKSKVLWQGEVHVLSEDEFMARFYGPASVDEALAERVEHVQGSGDARGAGQLPSKTVWQRDDFRFPPADLAPAADECRYAFEELYQTDPARNLFLLDGSGTYCAYSTGFGPAEEAAGFERALEACAELAGGNCYVYAAGDQLLPGKKRL